MKKKSFIVHDSVTNEEILIAAGAFCYAFCNDGDTLVDVGDERLSVSETIKEIQSLYEETEE